MDGNIIFLDIDGVMISREDIKRRYYRFNKHVPSWIPFSPVALASLELIVRLTDANIVLSSSWRKLSGHKEFICEQLARNGLADKLIDATPVIGRRDDEIKAWIEQNEFTGNFVILDDDSFDLTKYSAKLVKVSGKKGLTPMLSFSAIRRLGGRI